MCPGLHVGQAGRLEGDSLDPGQRQGEGAGGGERDRAWGMGGAGAREGAGVSLLVIRPSVYSWS